ncbi:putative sodium-dependent multivitamin transporter-like protein [Dinothrombium tinctorium]|uniref:Putative sodium-dependent multivitamin transporter-like protein n=1 Tax=Dinothrombium tinctorium TaxID=1965070 RepID=A0A3S3NQK3_9ACAR|nr:putative sodium-dependent multivitamin transporter-like protein [Dinothrombium tinctorium]
MSEERAVVISKILAFSYGLICLLVAYLAEKMTGILQASLTIFGVVGGPLLSLYTLGMCTKFCTAPAALISFLSSLAFGFVIGFGALYSGLTTEKLPLSTAQCALLNNSTVITTTPLSQTENDEVFYLFRISYMWYAGLCWLISIVIATIISFIFPSKKQNIDPSLLSPVYNFIFGGKTSNHVEISILNENRENFDLNIHPKLGNELNTFF